MVSKVKKRTNSVIDNSKNFQVITNTLCWVWDKKTGKVKEECRTEKRKIKTYWVLVKGSASFLFLTGFAEVGGWVNN
ncbi:MAG: hypothetical protein I3273_07405 [Candidatus Moeniiplasma glomeromycotorum]|nr:hypothetical protein [Candidatus Moeniiplasma glomeromycotorum]MCE8168342.1 hypothetical protein [Candidatus Moeniiplasma glomeromycotorum]MCE8169913.1 hypothetical protein [Candidatus Moeniiplasma glomeromycotorum]